MNKVSARSKGSKQTPNSAATATDRSILKRAAREDAEGGAPREKTPAQVISEAKATIAENLAKDHGPGVMEEFAAATKSMAEIAVPMTLGEICSVVGHDVSPELFASDALAAIADQIQTTAAIVDTAPDLSGESWRLFKNLADRAALAGRVAAWITAKTHGVEVES